MANPLKVSMKRVRAVVLALTALFATDYAAPTAEAAPLGVTHTMTLDLLAGGDTLGLDGASLALTILFDTADVYADVGGFPVIAATSDSLTISGASVSSSNGTFTSNNGVRFFPTFGGQYFGVTGGFANYTVGAVPLVLGRLTNPVAGIIPGDAIDAAHFGTTPFTTAENPGCNWCASTNTTLNVVTDSRYGVTDFTATAVPEPSTMLLLALGLLGAARSRGRRA